MNSYEKQNKRPKPSRKDKMYTDYSVCPKWMKEFYLNSMSINGSKCPIKLDQVMERYLEQFRKEFTGKFVRGLSPPQAAAICQQMNKQLIFFYNYFSDIKELFVISQFYDNMVEMLAIYFQLEMKSSKRFFRGRDTDHFICVRIMSLLWVFFAGHEEHMFHTLLKTPNFAKRYKRIFDPIFQKLLIKHKPSRTLTDLEYIRNLLTFKLWKRLFTVREKHAVTKLALTQLSPPKSFMSNGWKYKFLPIINFTRSIDIHIHLTTAFLDLNHVIKDYFNYLEESTNYFQYDFGAEKKSFISDLRESLTHETNDNLTDNLTDYLIDQFLMVPIKDQICTTTQDDDDLILTYVSTVSKLHKPRVTGVIDLTEDESSDSVESTPSLSQAQSEQSEVEIIEINDEQSLDEDSNESEDIPLNCQGIPVTVIGDFTMLEDSRLVLTEITDTAHSIQYEVVTSQIPENNTASTSAIMEHMDSNNGEYAQLTVIPCVIEQVEDILIENSEQLTNNNVIQTDESTVGSTHSTEPQAKPIDSNNPVQITTDYYNVSDSSLKLDTALNEQLFQDETILPVNSTSLESKFTTNFNTQLSPVAIKRPRPEDCLKPPYILQNISQTQLPSIPPQEPSYTLLNKPEVDLEPRTLDSIQSILMVDSFELAPNEVGLLNPVIRLKHVPASDQNTEKQLPDVEAQAKNRLPLKKRCISAINEIKHEDSVVSYPSTPMKSIAEFVSMHDHFVYLDNNNSKRTSDLKNENRSFISEYYASVSSNDQLNPLPDNLTHYLNDMFLVAHHRKDANNLTINTPENTTKVTEFTEEESKLAEIMKEEQIGDDLQVKPIRLNCRRICNIPLNIIGDVLTEITSTSTHPGKETVISEESDKMNTNQPLIQFENQNIPEYRIQNLISPTNTTDFCNSAPKTLLDYYDNSGGSLTQNTSPDVLVMSTNRTSVQSDMNNIIKPEFRTNTFQLNNNSYEQLSPVGTKRPRNENWTAEPRINIVPSELEVKTTDSNPTIWSNSLQLTPKEYRLLNPVLRLKRVPVPPESTSPEDETQTTKHLPLKKRRVSTLIKDDDDVICYPSTRMKSIAEFVNVKTESPVVTNTSSRIFKTPAELKEVPPLPESYLINTSPNDVFTGIFFTNPVYNNPINYANNVPVVNFPYMPQYLIPPLPLAPFVPNFYMGEALPNYSYINIPPMPFGACPTTLNPTKPRRLSEKSKETQKIESLLT